MDSERFDEFARTLTGGRASRRLVGQGLFATIAAGVPFLGNGIAVLGRRKHKKHKKHKKLLRCEGDSCDGTGGKECGGREDCQCYRHAGGGNVCASSRSTSCENTCSSDKQCPKGHVCTEGGPACCGSGERFCVKACYK